MSDATILNCPKCGASLDIARHQANAKCSYCGNTLSLPQEPETLQDLQAEQMSLVNNAIQSATELQSKQTAMASGILKSTMPIVVGGTVVLPLVIMAVTFIMIICIFGFVWYTISSSFSIFH
jgi:hypothetical protein